MPELSCPRCGYTNKHLGTFKRHLYRKNTCLNNFNNINIEILKESFNNSKYNLFLEGCSDNLKNDHFCVKPCKKKQNKLKNDSKLLKNTEKMSHECNFCAKKFNRNSNLVRHKKSCKEKERQDEAEKSLKDLVKLLNQQLEEERDFRNKQLQIISDELKKKEETLKEFKHELDRKNTQIDELIKKAGINNSTITNNIQQNIKLLAYKNTDLSHLEDADYLKCLSHSNMCIPHLIKKIHFDPKKPENQNIYISNLKNNYVMIYDGNKWNLHDRNEIFSDLIDNNEIILEQKLEDWIETGNKYPEIMKKFQRYIEKKENDTIINKIKEEIKLILYNNRLLIVKE